MARRPKSPGPVPVPPQDSPPEPPPEEQVEPEAETDEQIREGDTSAYTERPVKEGRGHHKEPSAGIFARMSEITKEDWEHYDIYLYRLAPIIDQSLAGKASFITKYRERIDEARVLSDFGSGGYRVCLNRLNDSGVSSNVFRADFNILNYSFPPKVVPGTWVDDPRNAKWAWAKPKETQPGTPGNGVGMTAADILTVVRETLDARLPQQTGPKDESIISAFNAGINAVKAAAPPVDKGSDKVFDLMMQRLDALTKDNQAMTERYLDLLKERATPATPAKSAREELKETLELMKEVQESVPRRGGSAPEQHPGWNLLERIAGPLADATPQIISVLTASKPIPQAGRPAAAPSARPAAAAGPNPTDPPTLPPGGKVEVGIQLPPVIAGHIMEALMWLQAHMAGQPGRSGTDYGDWLMGSPTTADVIPAFRALGADQQPPMTPVEYIIATAKSVPVVWNQIAHAPEGEMKLREFLTELVMWTPPPPEEAGGPDEEPAS